MHEQIAIVQAYINHRTGKTVNIRIESQRDVILLMQAYKIAIDWFNENNGKKNYIR